MNKGITHTIQRILELSAPKAMTGDEVYHKTLLTQRCKQGPQPQLWRKIGHDKYAAL